MTYVTPILLALFRVTLLRLALLCFVVNVPLIFSEVTAIPVCGNKLCTYLGKLSMPIYIWHMVVGKLLSVCVGSYPMRWKVAAYFVGTFLISAMNIAIVEKMNARRK